MGRKQQVGPCITPIFSEFISFLLHIKIYIKMSKQRLKKNIYIYIYSDTFR